MGVYVTEDRQSVCICNVDGIARLPNANTSTNQKPDTNPTPRTTAQFHF